MSFDNPVNNMHSKLAATWTGGVLALAGVAFFQSQTKRPLHRDKPLFKYTA
jgi:hypothetical protein